MRTILLAIVSAMVAGAQPPAPGPPWDTLPTPTPPPAQVPPKPCSDMFLTAGSLYTSAASPHYSGWLGAGKLVSSTPSCMYSFSAAFFTREPGGRVVNTMATGLAPRVGTILSFDLYVLGLAGVAMTSGAAQPGTSVGGALSAGLFAVRPIRGGVSLNLFGQSLTVAGTTRYIGGIGFGWGK